MSLNHYRTRAMQAADPRYRQIFGLLGMDMSDTSAPLTDEDRLAIKAARDTYQAKTGKKPWMGWDLETLQQKLSDLE